MSTAEPGTDSAVPQTPDVGGKRRHPILWTLGACVLLVVAAAGWMGLGLRHAVDEIKRDADAAQSDLVTAKKALEAGDTVQAEAAAASASANVAAAKESAGALPVRLVGHVPYFGAAVTDVDHLIAAAADLSEASTQAVTVYGSVAGKAGAPGALFHNGAVDFAVLDTAEVAAQQVSGLLDKAEASLRQVQATSPGTGSLASARDKALAQLAPIRSTIHSVTELFPLLPKALGRGTTVNYLLTIDNEGQLRASGGAPLSVAVLRFQDGKLSVPVQGQVSTEIFPKNRLLSWQHVIPAVWPSDVAPRFLSANIHPDYGISGEEMIRAWNSSGQPKVNGVVSIDMNAIAAVLKTTGPVDAAGFGQITSSNLVSKLLVDAYQQYDGNQKVRHSLNDALARELITRISSGGNLLGVVKALASVAPGRHLQMHMRDAGLQQRVVLAGFSGELPKGRGDRLDVYSQNNNGGKLDVFSKRTMVQKVVLRADGSARVTRTLTVHNDTPPQLSGSPEGGYLTGWSSNRWYLYIPRTATGVSLATPAGYTTPTLWADGIGGVAMQVIGQIKPGGTAVFTMTYSLPAGTFPGGVYVGTASPQPTLLETSLQVTVVHPDGSVTLARALSPYNGLVSLRTPAS